MAVGRFAPSPTGDLHLGNLRTALLAWLWSRRDGDAVLLRMEDLDRVTSSPDHERSQAADLAAIGLDFDGPVVRQSDRFDLYGDALGTLERAGLLYPCYCTRREIAAAAAAPHAEETDGRYPGTCRELTAARRAELEAEGRPPALRLRAERRPAHVVDAVLGPLDGEADDVVVRRNDGVPAYHLAVVVDDAVQGVGVVVRGDDLAPVVASQVALQAALGLPTPAYAHVPLVLGPGGRRLAKRDGAVTLAERRALGQSAAEVTAWLLATCGVAVGPATPDAAGTADTDPVALVTAAAATFDRAALPRAPLRLTQQDVAGTGRDDATAALTSSDPMASPPPSGSDRA